MAKRRKALNFDLDTAKLKEFYGSGYPNAYYDLRCFLEKEGFVHRQGSGYVSRDYMTTLEVAETIEKMAISFPWFSGCVKEIDMTSVGRTYSMKNVIHEAEKLRESETVQETETEEIEL